MAKKKSHKKIKFAIALAVVLGIAIFMTISRPSESDHSAVMQDRFEQVAYSYLGASSDGLISLLVEPAVSKIMKSCFKVDNYVLWSVGRVIDPSNPDAEPTTVSVGLLNHVFAPSPERIRKTIDETEEAQAVRQIFNSLKK